jgi:tRNA (guanine10-N2)-dimethyltransferase
MRYIFFLSGENPKLAKAEVLYLLKSHHQLEIVDFDDQIIVVRTEKGAERLFSRLALVHEVCRLIDSCHPSELEDAFSKISVPRQRVCVRVKGIKHKFAPEMERKLGAILWRRGAKISVSKPEITIKVYVASKAYVGFLLHSTNTKQFLLRRPNKKPFFKPGVILPRFAKALVNLTGISENEILLDPMCGTGTILMEAGLMGVRFLGVEAFDSIINGCALNLKHFNLPINVIQGDARRLPFKKEMFHALITDFPYLQSSRSYGKLVELYTDSINEFHRVLKTGRRAVIVSNMDVDKLILNFFKIEERFYQRIHKTLTRRIFLCKKD